MYIQWCNTYTVCAMYTTKVLQFVHKYQSWILLWQYCLSLPDMGRRVARIWKGGEGFFERVKKVQTTLTWIFIVLESVSHGLSENWDGIFRKARKFKRCFSPRTGGLQKKKKKKVFTEIETDFSARIGNSNAFSYRITRSTSQLRHPISFGGEGAVFNFSPKIGLKSTKNVRFCLLHTPMGGLEPPPPPPPGYATGHGYVQELVWKYGRLSSIPFHSGIFHIPYRNFRSIPYHALTTTDPSW